MKTLMPLLVSLALATPLLAGDIHGKVVAKGMRDSADAVVYVAAVPGKTFAPKGQAQMNQQNMKFEPHVLPVLEGTTVEFLNSDSVTHNVFSPDACAPKFNLGTWPKGQTKAHLFAKPCFASILCMIHPEMEAFVAVLPTPYYAVTDANGGYSIANVPDGAYTVKVWHPKLKGTQKAVTVAGPTAADFEVAR